MLHQPVLLTSVIDILSPQAGRYYLDCTFGAGGYSRAILSQEDCFLYALDQDKSVMTIAEELREEFVDRFKFIQGNFGNLDALAKFHELPAMDGIVFDIGVSSMQLDQKERGFSFNSDVALDMRMQQDSAIPTAADLLNEASEEEIANKLWHYGGERKARHIARAIIAKRPIKTTAELAALIRSIVPKGKHKIDPATRSFQALRIWVNDELGNLERGLEAAFALLKPQGKLLVVSFHSEEDIIVKHFFNQLCGKMARSSRHYADYKEEEKVKLAQVLTKKPIIPSIEEIKANPRSRSAKLRAIQKIEVAQCA